MSIDPVILKLSSLIYLCVLKRSTSSKTVDSTGNSGIEAETSRFCGNEFIFLKSLREKFMEDHVTSQYVCLTKCYML